MFRKDRYFIVNLVLIVAGLTLAVIGLIRIFQNISEGNPADGTSVFSILIGLSVSMASFFRIQKPETGVAGDERTKRAVEKAGFWAYLILLGCLLLLGLVNSLWESTRNFYMMPFLISSIGVFSWGILTCYFDKKGDVE